jgi:hypothetical protein
MKQLSELKKQKLTTKQAKSDNSKACSNKVKPDREIGVPNAKHSKDKPTF